MFKIKLVVQIVKIVVQINTNISVNRSGKEYINKYMQLSIRSKTKWSVSWI